MIKDAGPHKAGDTPDLPNHVAQGWISMGLAIQDKSVDGPTENKVSGPTETKEITTRSKRKTK
jgi:hypothetical protein